MIPVIIALIVIQAYLLGSIPFGLLVARSQGMDIRQHGSGNIGATNVWRVLGKKYGLITFFFDAAKGWLAVIIGMKLAAMFAPGIARTPADTAAYAGIAAALGCIIGHSFPLWLGFKGGKGVATSLGVVFGMLPLASLVIFAVWGLVLKLTRYVSLASIIAALSLPVTVLAMLFLGWVEGWGLFYFALAACLLVVFRHRENMRRLMAGTESRFGKKPS
ncbi:MAG: glycerol-3-phosphate 1-O-acyltransferase PlsY, partial [Chthoniobacteraceae bacterium]